MSTTEETPRLKIRTQHCRFCNHLLLATTRILNTLPRRSGETKDKAIILPLEAQTQDPEIEDNVNVSPNTKHTTLLLSTTLPDRRATLIRREDGIEKRILLRCGRCRVVMGYYLDKVHWGTSKRVEHNTEDGEESEEAQRPPAVYILPGAVVETEEMGEKDGGVGEMEWRTWGDV